jgi:hypothetical protein
MEGCVGGQSNTNISHEPFSSFPSVPLDRWSYEKKTVIRMLAGRRRVWGRGGYVDVHIPQCLYVAVAVGERGFWSEALYWKEDSLRCSDLLAMTSLPLYMIGILEASVNYVFSGSAFSHPSTA